MTKALELSAVEKHRRREIFNWLRKNGFTKRDDLSTPPQMICYQKACPEDEVMLDVQIWDDNKHRISYWHRNYYVPMEFATRYGCMDTTPTPFRTACELARAVKREQTRWLAGEKAKHIAKVRAFQKLCNPDHPDQFAS